jgi:hypothetical protein
MERLSRARSALTAKEKQLKRSNGTDSSQGTAAVTNLSKPTAAKKRRRVRRRGPLLLIVTGSEVFSEFLRITIDLF